MKSKTTPEEKQQMIAIFNAMDPDIPDRYAQIAKQFNRSTSTVFSIVKKSQQKEPKIKLFNPRIFQF